MQGISSPSVAHRVAALLSALLLLHLAGCAARPSVKYSAAYVAPDGTLTMFDGYRDATADESRSTLVFIHCWAGEAGMWKAQVQAFKPQRDILVVDLPGHGRSRDVHHEKQTISALTDDVVGVITESHVQHPDERYVLIGHSMGGPIALGVAKRLRRNGIDCVDGVIGVDTLQDAEFAFPSERLDAMAKQFDADYEAMMATMVGGMLPADVDPAVKGSILATANAADRATTVALLRDFANVDLKTLFREVGVPVVCINSVPHGDKGVPTAVETNRKYARFDVILIDGTGHYPHLERPDEFNDALRKALEMIAAAR